MLKTWKTIFEKIGKAFHNKNQKKNPWEAVAKDIGLETGEAAKNAFKNAFAIISISFDFGAIIIFLFGLIFWS